MTFKTLHPRISDSVVRVPDLAALSAIGDPQLGDIRFVDAEDTLYVYKSGGWEISGGGGIEGPDPAITTDNAVVRWDGTDASAIQDSSVIINDSNELSGVTKLTVDNVIVDGNEITTDTDTSLSLNPNGTGTVTVQKDLQLRSGSNARFYNAGNTAAITVTAAPGLSTFRTPQIPDDTGNFVLDSATQALTNKSIDADANTITNIENADIKTGAAIDAEKIHDGSVSNTEFGYLNGVTSAIQTQINSTNTSLASHLLNTITHGTTGNIVGTTDTQTLTNKTIVAASNTITTAASGNLTATELNNALAELQSDIDTREVAANKGVANGYASLDSGGKVPTSQLPNSIMEYLGTWAASTNTPTLTNGTGNAGDVYIASDAGTVDFGAGNITFATGDWVVYSGSVWEKSTNSNSVASVFSRTGAVTAQSGDYTASQVTNTPSGNLVATDVQAALNELQSEIDTQVVGPGSATDNAVARFDTTTGKLVQNSVVTIDDSGIVEGLSGLQATGNLTLYSDTGDIFISHGTTGDTKLLSGDLGLRDDTTSNFSYFHVDPGTITADRTLTLPNLSGTLALTDGAQTLTSKTIDGNSNTLTVLAGSQLSGATPIANGGTGQTSQTAAFDALAPTTTQGDLIVMGASDNERLAVGSEGQVLKVTSGVPAWGDAGGGSGEKNYIENPSAASAITGWTANGDLDVARTTTAAELPREYTTGSGIKITADANTQSTADYVYYDFTLDDVDLNKKLKIQWAQKQTGSYNASDLAVIITTQADRTTALHTPTTTNIPAYDGVFQTEFDSGSTATLSLVIRATTDMATDAGIVISDVIVGPGQVTPVPAIGTWQSYTPTGSFTTNTTYSGFWKQNVDTMEIRALVSFSGTPNAVSMTLDLPEGYTIDTTKLVSTNAYLGIDGFAKMKTSAGTPFFLSLGYTDTNTIGVYTLDDVSGGIQITAGVQDGGYPVTIASGTICEIYARVPIAEWAGAPNYAGQNDVEYAYNSSTSTTSDTTSFAYGPAGVPVYSFAPGGTSAVTKRVRFQTTAQVGETYNVEINNGTGGWFSLGSSLSGFASNDAGTAYYGIDIVPVNSTDVDVRFYSQAFIGVNWSVVSSWKWRVVKTKAGAAVGFGKATQNSLGLVKAGQVPGTNTNDSAPTGYIGEIVTTSRSFGARTPVSSATPLNVGASAMVLEPGDWDISGIIALDYGSAPTLSQSNAAISITSAALPGTGAYIPDASGQLHITDASAIGATGSQKTIIIPTYRVSIASQTTYYLVAQFTFTGGTSTTVYGYAQARRAR